MSIENDPSARMQLRSRGELRHPGSCMICGNGTNDDGYVDLGVFFDYEGTMYLDMTCALQIAVLIGCVTPDDIKIFQEAAEKAAKERDDLHKDLDNAQHHIDTVNALLRSKFLPGSVSPDNVGEEPIPDEQSADKPSPRGASRKPIIKEPTPFS